MDILVKQAVTKSGDQKTAPSTPTSFNKPCRYGSNCTRHSCRFMHPGQMTESNQVSLFVFLDLIHVFSLLFDFKFQNQLTPCLYLNYIIPIRGCL